MCAGGESFAALRAARHLRVRVEGHGRSMSFAVFSPFTRGENIQVSLILCEGDIQSLKEF
jgi:hypothetical protein